MTDDSEMIPKVDVKQDFTAATFERLGCCMLHESSRQHLPITTALVDILEAYTTSPTTFLEP